MKKPPIVPAKAKKIFWIAGENSGDLHAAEVIASIRKIHPDWQHFGVGGQHMQRAGFNSLFPFERFSVMGFVEVIRHLGFFLKVERKIEKILRRSPPDLIVLVDYPGLNMRIARIAHKIGIKVLYYICPQFWAWKKNRLKQLEKFTDQVVYILPFEKKYLDEYRVKSTYVGHPIAEEIEFAMERQEFADKYSLDPKKEWLGFMPGSRNIELKRMLPQFLKAISYFEKDKYEILISRAPTVSEKLFNKIISAFPGIKYMEIIADNYCLIRYCRCLSVTSGTATLESAYIGTPCVIVYKAGKLSYELGKRLIRIDMIGLPNIILKQRILPELIQHEANGIRIYNEMSAILSNHNRYSLIKNKLSELHDILGSKSASRNTRDIIIGLVNE